MYDVLVINDWIKILESGQDRGRPRLDGCAETKNACKARLLELRHAKVKHLDMKLCSFYEWPFEQLFL